MHVRNVFLQFDLDKHKDPSSSRERYAQRWTEGTTQTYQERTLFRPLSECLPESRKEDILLETTPTVLQSSIVAQDWFRTIVAAVAINHKDSNSNSSQTSYTMLDEQHSPSEEALLKRDEADNSGGEEEEAPDSFHDLTLLRSKYQHRRQQARLLKYSIATNIVLCLIVALLSYLVLAYAVLTVPRRQSALAPATPDDAICAACDSAYTPPPLRNLIRRRTTLFTADLDISTPFKGQPTPDVEAAWANITSIGMIRLTDADLTALNRHTYTLHPSLGGGGMGFIAVFHQLHCIDMLRRGVSEWHYGHRPDSSGGYHLDHCLDVLRQATMCRADTNILTWDWVPGMTLPVANGTVEHTCRDFDAIYSWASARNVKFEDVLESARLHNLEADAEAKTG
ncbi:hypothetical protein PV04_05365 [Phialophora macrospora]|uniref:Tat pathway signal sequence n=1 Tax=Phialophora macrospora TaxID=1851006 RepID=A0A0D2E594_9EURO|nr:hypothetical protein PV04_05365 [Phialophora macrospora]